MTDPTREEMLDYLALTPAWADSDEFDREEAIYWFASDWHGGQWSNLYAALCGSPYSPGPLSKGCEPDSISSYLYDELEQHFATTKAEG